MPYGTQQKLQSGFTLVEIAVVLVIIGLLLGAVLKGQELIDNTKVKRAANDMNGVTAAFHGYRDRYKRLPGDDGPLATLSARGGSWGSVTEQGDGDGVVGVTLTQTWNGGGEGAAFWQHLRASGLIAGDPAMAGAAALPQNAFGGLMGVTSSATMGGLGGLKICMSQVPGKLAVALDNQLDDGLPGAGSFRASDASAGSNTSPRTTASTAYNEDNLYTICRVM